MAGLDLRPRPGSAPAETVTGSVYKFRSFVLTPVHSLCDSPLLRLLAVPRRWHSNRAASRAALACLALTAGYIFFRGHL